MPHRRHECVCPGGGAAAACGAVAHFRIRRHVRGLLPPGTIDHPRKLLCGAPAGRQQVVYGVPPCGPRGCRRYWYVYCHVRFASITLRLVPPHNPSKLEVFVFPAFLVLLLVRPVLWLGAGGPCCLRAGWLTLAGSWCVVVEHLPHKNCNFLSITLRAQYYQHVTSRL